MPLCKIGAAAALGLAVATLVACAGPAATATSGTASGQASTPASGPSVETINPGTGAASTGQTAAPPVPSENLVWRLAPREIGPFQAGAELSLTLDLDPENLALSGIQFSLNYPEKLLQLREIVPGAILGPDPIVINKMHESDSSIGQVLFAMARRGDTGGPSGPGRVASIKLLTRQEIPENGNVMIWLDGVKLTGAKFETIRQDSVSWSLSGPD